MNSVKTAHDDWNAEAYKSRRSSVSLKGKRWKSNFGLSLPNAMVPTAARETPIRYKGEKIHNEVG